MILKHPTSKQEIEAPEGFSFTVLFFGVFVSLLRGDLIGTFIMFFAAVITGGLSWLVFPFFYNRMYINSLVKKGYVEKSSLPKNEKSSTKYYVSIRHRGQYNLFKMKENSSSIELEPVSSINLEITQPDKGFTEELIINNLRGTYEEVKLFNDRPTAEDYIESKSTK